MKSRFLSLAAAVALMASCSTPQPATTGTTTTTTTDATGTTTQTSTSTNAALSVPAGIQTSFTARYPTASAVTWSTYDVNTVPVDWELTGWTVMDNSDYVARFRMDDQDYYALYDANGDWIGSYYVVSNNNSLPAAVNSLITSRFNGYTISKVQREFWGDKNAYEIKLVNGENKVKLLVDENGTILKQKNKD